MKERESTNVSDGFVAEIKSTKDVEKIFVQRTILVEEPKVWKGSREISHNRPQVLDVILLH